MQTGFTQIVVLVEGQTEEGFVKEVLQPYLQKYNIWITPTIINTKIVSGGSNFKGGSVTFGKAQRDLTRLLKDKSIWVTTFFDFYRLGSDFPGYAQLGVSSDPIEDKIVTLEREIENAIGEERFKAYIQPFEFEALLFASLNGFSANFADEERFLKGVEQIIQEFPNPEEINDHPETAPSNRLRKLKPNYEKVFHGNMIALSNGVETMLEKCPHFAGWVSWLISLG